jgi:hypothetical protein
MTIMPYNKIKYRLLRAAAANRPRSKMAAYWRGYLRAARGLHKKGMASEKMIAELEKIYYKGVLDRDVSNG